ncbi:hypothetical protein CQU01_04440 [Cerasibacillus quisquiliarum]|uniref:Uncharacterized protein n=1 Tax=Cerasibacillus quisquiliarum TaxID=227865 RepID=A0A511UUC4_9BACI|nr:hypothetical protein CQU01_04440 [Cerasibacillus quisquiliarum]
MNYFNSEAIYTKSMLQKFVDPFEIYRNKYYKKARNKTISRSKLRRNIKHLFNIYTLFNTRANNLDLGR